MAHNVLLSLQTHYVPNKLNSRIDSRGQGFLPVLYTAESPVPRWCQGTVNAQEIIVKGMNILLYREIQEKSENKLSSHIRVTSAYQSL